MEGRRAGRNDRQPRDRFRAPRASTTSCTSQDWSWLKGYVPIGRLVLAAARRIGFIQTGNIHTYLKYSFVTLLFFLWIVS